MAAVDLWVDSNHVGDIWRLDEDLVEYLLSGVVELVGEDPSFQTKSVVIIFTNNIVEKSAPPPNT